MTPDKRQTALIQSPPPAAVPQRAAAAQPAPLSSGRLPVRGALPSARTPSRLPCRLLRAARCALRAALPCALPGAPHQGHCISRAGRPAERLAGLAARRCSGPRARKPPRWSASAACASALHARSRSMSRRGASRSASGRSWPTPWRSSQPTPASPPASLAPKPTRRARPCRAGLARHALCAASGQWRRSGLLRRRTASALASLLLPILATALCAPVAFVSSLR